MIRDVPWTLQDSLQPPTNGISGDGSEEVSNTLLTIPLTLTVLLTVLNLANLHVLTLALD